MTDFCTETELEQLGYVRHRLTELFGEPDTAGNEERWPYETVHAVECDVLAPAARVVFTAFEPDLDTRAGMTPADLRFGWPQMEQMLARATLREDQARSGRTVSSVAGDEETAAP
ncbi:hypothetical protein CBI38_31190 (plasmid) [Rhodococcus oxybenzonivorans]|uniref:Uncharacterized protein n=1 Tax=Rhodococcus oxybenzonivorans TaxID=1990687 RepID=A0A2S2C570_9NOCA|nr:hypothetical protein [Rhodococcus oxybenzonivorans]AWK76041.1 hypothetical protein CBI38_31190 [Rhodococcus oxybenzonivorans]